LIGIKFYMKLALIRADSGACVCQCIVWFDCPAGKCQNVLHINSGCNGEACLLGCHSV